MYAIYPYRLYCHLMLLFQMYLLDLNKVGHTNESYSTEQEALIRRALIAAEQQPLNAELAEQITRYRRALAPHKELSEDVLRHIFTLACDDGDVAVLNTATAKTQAAVKLSYVCSAWRRLAPEMPHLWVQIQVNMQNSRQAGIINKNDGKIQLAETWLTRGGSLLKTLFLSSSQDRNYDPMKQLIFPYSYRILFLWLCERDLESLRDIEPEHMVPLRHLTIRWKNPQHRLLQFSLPLPAKMADLSHLSLDSCIKVNLQKLVIAVPWHRLVHLKLAFHVPSMTCYNVILRQGLSLTYCILYPATDPHFVIDPNTEPLILPRMMTMILGCTSATDARLLDRWAETPNARCRDIDS